MSGVAPQPVGLVRLRCDYPDTPFVRRMPQPVDLRLCWVDKQVPAPTKRRLRSTNDNLHLASVSGTWARMALIVTFLLGMGNFACHSAVVQSGHRMLSGIAEDKLRIARMASLALEFALLCGALYAAQAGVPQWLWLYGGYTIINAGAAWSIVSGKV